MRDSPHGYSQLARFTLAPFKGQLLQYSYVVSLLSFDGNNEQKALFSELSLRVVNSRIERYTLVLSPVIPQLRDILVDPPVVNI